MNEFTAAFTKAMEDTRTRNTAVVALLGNRVSASEVSSWRAGRRPIPAEHAPAIGVLLNVPPEQISGAYARTLMAGLSAQTVGLRSVAGHVMIERLEGFSHLEGTSRVALPEFLVRPKIGLTRMESLRWTVQPSLAMEPDIRQNALVLVDMSVSQQAHVVDRGLYAYTLWDRPDIRRIVIRRDAWSLCCGGKDADSTEVSESDLEHLRVLGAVIGWINPA